MYSCKQHTIEGVEILGETLTIENSEGGSQAATRIHKEVLEDIQASDKDLVEDGLSQVAERIVLLNMGPDVLPPKARLANPTALSVKTAERDVILAKDIGVRFEPEYIQKTYNLKETDFTIVPPSTVAPPQIPSLFQERLPDQPTRTLLDQFAMKQFQSVEGISDALDDRDSSLAVVL